MLKKITFILTVTIMLLSSNGFQTIAEELPAGFPQITVFNKSNPAPGYMFFNSFQFGNPLANYNIITDSAGNVYKYHKPLPAGFDFKMHSMGKFSYAMPIAIASQYQQGPFLVQNYYVQFVVTDTNFKILDQVQMQNGYLADLHEFVILPNGHYLMMAYYEVPMDMSLIVPGGDPNAVMVATILQELDKDKNCIFEWNSLNHMALTDTYDDLRKKSIEHAHGNSMFIDTDGHMLVSMATTNDIVKLDVVSGEILWRMGGKKNEFKIINENEANAPLYFTLQHDVHKLDNGNLMLFDNGYMRQNKYSRAVEYKIDETKKEAEMVWEYRSNPDIFAVAMGSSQRLKNGNTLISWGLMASQHQRTVIEVDKNNNIVFEMSLPKNMFSYKAIKYNWPICKPVADVNKYELKAGNTYTFSENNQNTGLKLKINTLDAFMYNIVNVKKMECAPQNPEFDGEAPEILPLRWVIEGNQVAKVNADITIDGNTIKKILSPTKFNIYFRETEGKGKFTKLATTYDQFKNSYTANANGLGEFILGLERSVTKILPPHPLMPTNSKKIAQGIPFNLKWNASSRYDKFNLQVATDDKFQNILLDTVINRKTSISNLFTEKNKYFWRVKTHYTNITSEWSEVFNFEIGDPFFKIAIPNGGERYAWDSTVIIRWNTNLQDSVRISLFNGQDLVAVIVDSLKSHFNAYKWIVPSSVPPGKNYKIKVENKKNGQFTTMSENEFEIFDPTGNVDFETQFASIKGYPNPSSEKMFITLDVVKPEQYSISLFTILGNKIQTIYDGYLDIGTHSFTIDILKMNKGVYLYEVKIGGYSKVDKLIVE